MKRLVLALTGLAVGAVVFWPAATFEDTARRALPPSAQVSLIGTVWNGRGVIGLNGSGYLVKWEFDSAGLPTLRLVWKVESVASPTMLRADVSVGFSGVEISNLGFSGDAARIADLVPLAKLAGAKGLMTLDSAESLKLRPASPWQAEGQGTLVLQDLVIGTLSATPTGTHRIEVRGAGDTLAFEVRKSEGPITLEGKGALNNRNEFAFAGSALPLSTLEPEARARLARWASPQSDGRYRIEVKTKW